MGTRAFPQPELVGHACRTFWGPTLLPALTGLAWVREVPSGQLAPRGGTVVGLAVERLMYWQGGSYLFCPPVRSATRVQLC